MERRLVELNNLLRRELETQVEEVEFEQPCAELEIGSIAIRRILVCVLEGNIRQRAEGPQISVGKSVARCEILHPILMRHVDNAFTEYGLEDCLESTFDTRETGLRKAVSDGSVKDAAETYVVLNLKSASIALKAVHDLDYARVLEDFTEAPTKGNGALGEDV